jgi:putative CRISPR-associated protein (TIGR02619 family)
VAAEFASNPWEPLGTSAVDLLNKRLPNFATQVGSELIDQFIEEGTWKTSAEYDAVSLLRQPPSNGLDRLVLIHSAALDSRLAAELLERGFRQEGLNSELRLVEGLTRDFRDFEKAGYQNLVRTLADSIRNCSEQDGRAPVVVAQGGFKVQTSMATILGLLEGCEVVYTYEQSGRLVKVGPFPLAIDDRLAERQLGSIPEDDPIAVLINGALDRQRKPLPYLSQVAKSAPDALEAQRPLLERLVKEWVAQELWQGDRLPQMVDHGVAHSRVVDRHVTTLALRVLALRVAKFTPEVLVALVAAAWLHDIGHAGGMLNGRFIRDYRHVRRVHCLLSRQRIIEEDRIIPDDGDRTTALLRRQLVGWLCAYHQRFMPITSNSAEPFDCEDACEVRELVSGFASHSLEERLNGLVPDIRPWVEAAAILRIADAVDLGRHRVGGRHFGGAEAWNRMWRRQAAQDLLDVVERVGDKKNWSKEAAARALRAYLECPADSFNSDHNQAFVELDMTTDLEEFRRYLAFLADQGRHATLHDSIRRSDISFLDGGFRVRLALLPWAEEQRQESVATQAGQYIWDEYEGIKHILEGMNLALMEVVVVGPSRQWSIPANQNHR